MYSTNPFEEDTTEGKFCRTRYTDSDLVSEKAIAAVPISVTAFL